MSEYDDSDQKRDAGIYYDAAHIPDLANVYAIGPYGHRVNFASQQQRALNTVWAIEMRHKDTFNGSRVAVIGGGLAGITAAIALKVRGCNVYLYEKGPDVLHLQEAATHRFVHPTLNFWPNEPIQPTTRLPFLEWYSDDCNEIIACLREQWNELKEHINVFVGKNIKGLIPAQDGHNKWNVKVEYEIEKKKRAEKFLLEDEEITEEQVVLVDFDFVVLAVGFGEEKTAEKGSNPQSYWTPDIIALQPGVRWRGVVSGSGDGAIIDALRVVHKNFDNGRLCLRVIHRLEKHAKSCVRAIKNLEERAETASKDYKQKYEKEYLQIARDCAATLHTLLDESLVSNRRLSLICKNETAFLMQSAPIHKLMLAHAINNNAIVAVPGELNGSKQVLLGKDKDPVSINYSPIVRHGPNKDLSKLIDVNQVEALLANQSKLDKYPLNKPYRDEGYWNSTEVPVMADQSESKTFLEKRFNIAKKFISRNFGMRIEIRLISDKAGEKFVYAVKKEAEIDDVHSRKDIFEKLPNNIFGISLQYEEAFQEKTH